MRSATFVPMLLLASFLGPPRGSEAGQSALSMPVVEVGAGLTQVSPEGHYRPAIASRVSVRVGRRTGLEGAFDRQASDREGGFTDIFSVQLRHTLHHFDRGRAFATAGFSRANTTFHPRDADADRYGLPREYAFSALEYGLTMGVGVEREITRFLAARGDVQFIFSDDPLVRVTGGVSVPVGRYPRPPKPGAAATLPAGHPLAALAPGRTVWVVTEDGALERGELVAASRDEFVFERRGLTRRVPMRDVRQVEVADRLFDGLWKGAIIGAAGGVGFGALLSGLCEGASGCAAEAMLILGGTGAAMGGVIGLIADAIREHGRVIFRAGGR